MKPKTKMHHEVIALHNKHIKPDNERILQFGQKLFDTHGSLYFKKPVCLECGERFNTDKDQNLLVNNMAFDTLTCPCCNAKLKYIEVEAFNSTRFLTHTEMISYYDVIGNYQVIKTYIIFKHMKRGQKATYALIEFFELWLHIPSKKIVVYGRLERKSYYNYGIHGDQEIRLFNNDYNYQNTVSYGKIKIHPELLKRGLTGRIIKRTKNLFVIELMRALLIDSTCETITKNFSYLLGKLSLKGLHEIFDQLKICQRNNYVITDAITYFDYIRDLITLNKDTHNPKYICPADIKKAHQVTTRAIQILQAKREAKRKKEELKALIENMEIDNIAYKQKIKRFTSLKLEKGDITIELLMDVYEVKKEGELLNHCVFTNKYHNKNVLLLTCQVDGVHLETAEINIDPIYFNQCRGYNNEDSPYHKEFVELIESNFDLIKKLKRKRITKQKVKSPAAAIV